uniref:Uncharacterized protein n=1 Tax=Spongospora subterranea TaxID=70186 RepID=A0A0H5QXE1_9EUKA|eukprot:CRZ06610.1 hypothetical protein [Spongospora subterranea]
MSDNRFHRVRMQGGRERQIFVHNFSGHILTEKAESRIKTLGACLRYLVACATDKIQPCDSFVISKIKDEWTRRWELYKFEQIKSGVGFKNIGRKDGRNSGAIKNPKKTWFLQLAADCVRAVNAMRDENGVSYAGIAMIRCGLSLDLHGQWHTGQLSLDLQTIIKKNRQYFDGKFVPAFNSSKEDNENILIEKKTLTILPPNVDKKNPHS